MSVVRMIEGKYIGKIPELYGKEALLKLYSTTVKAQFHDDIRLNGIMYAYGWHEFPIEDFLIP